MRKRKHDLASGGSDVGGGSGAPRVGPPGSVGTFCLCAVGSSLPEPPVRVAGHEYGRTQPRARVGPGSDHHSPLFQFAFVQVTKLAESLRESHSR